ncbi:VOC family protein [Mesorhizobium sp. BR1-1-16]|uniref:VOC family protein n=1 Tax=Mesorhizobium sp. BR1-1-16 TaxID=2876653 RepID=UPI001CCC33C0|nr:VOC family protein [Mesorhizobium sp. BR1-1-16]MBZ9937340.1 VOC family protein [Mesorhizobium sp. BR1-1-16]
MIPNAIEVVTLFVDDIAAAKQFYCDVFTTEILMEDDQSALLSFSGAIVNLLAASNASTLVEPLPVAPAKAGTRAMFTVRVDDVRQTCARLTEKGVTILNGPIDRPWGRRTAAFADPSGHVWEVAEEI